MKISPKMTGGSNFCGKLWRISQMVRQDCWQTVFFLWGSLIRVSQVWVFSVFSHLLLGWGVSPQPHWTVERKTDWQQSSKIIAFLLLLNVRHFVAASLIMFICPDDRSRFLRFVTGRRRLPAPLYICPGRRWDRTYNRKVCWPLNWYHCVLHNNYSMSPRWIWSDKFFS